MNLFIECEAADELDGPLALGLCDGVRTTQGEPRVLTTLLAAAPGPVLVPASGADAEALLLAARRLGGLDDRLTVVLPATPAGLAACAVCYDEGIATVVGPCGGAAQALLAAKAGATWVALSLAALDAVGADGPRVIDDTLQALSTYDEEAQLLVTGLAHPRHLQEAVVVGAHAAVVRPGLLDSVLVPPR